MTNGVNGLVNGGVDPGFGTTFDPPGHFRGPFRQALEGLIASFTCGPRLEDAALRRPAKKQFNFTQSLAEQDFRGLPFFRWKVPGMNKNVLFHQSSDSAIPAPILR